MPLLMQLKSGESLEIDTASGPLYIVMLTSNRNRTTVRIDAPHGVAISRCTPQLVVPAPDQKTHSAR